MCGIFGYVGRKEATPILIEGLKRLEYRGYDSAGLYVPGLGAVKAVGPVKNLQAKVAKKKKSNGKEMSIGIAHTRWATHGKPSERNAHPHSSYNKRITVVHNGVIENASEIRNFLEKRGVPFRSDTDTEVIPQLIAFFLKNSRSVFGAIQQTLQRIRGSYAIALVDTKTPNTIWAIRNGSPLVIGISQDETFISSDENSMRGFCREIVVLENHEIARIEPHKCSVTSFSGRNIPKTKTCIVDSFSESKYTNHTHHMFQEILEQSEALSRAITPRIHNGRVVTDELAHISATLRRATRIMMVGCGTAYYGGMAVQNFFETTLRLPTQTVVSSEFSYNDSVIDGHTVCIALSQSGETADTIRAIDKAKRAGAVTIGIINAPNSTMSRMVDACIYTHAGPEIGVASTKALTTQIATSLLLVYMIAAIRGTTGSKKLFTKNIQQLRSVPALVREVLTHITTIQKIAKRYVKYSNIAYLGRGSEYAVALEGALKLKEISYVHAEGFCAGEIKHGPLALIDPQFPSVVIAPGHSMYEKNLSTIREIKARSGRVLAIGTVGDRQLSIIANDILYVPAHTEFISPIITVIPLQLFAYYVATAKSLNVDKPRNLAKSVTVE